MLAITQQSSINSTGSNQDYPDTLQLRLRLAKGISLFFALATAIGWLLRILVAPLPTEAMLMNSVSLVGFLLAYLAARFSRRLLSGTLILVTMIIVIIITGYMVGALSAPVFAIIPLIPLTACLLIGPTAGWLCSGAVVLILGALVGMDLAGISMPARELSEQQARIARAIMLSITCVLATAIVWYYERLQKKLHTMATHDPLTGIANRGSFDRQLTYERTRAMRSSEPVSLVMFDLDHFKLFNDSFGHPAGDDCLKAITAVVVEQSRRVTDFFARYGGEEFVLILPSSNADDALSFAELLRQKIADLNIPHPASEHDYVTVSMGVATFLPDSQMTAVQLISHADVALYQAKTSGRNKVIAYKTSNQDFAHIGSDNA